MAIFEQPVIYRYIYQTDISSQIQKYKYIIGSTSIRYHMAQTMDTVYN